MLSHGLTQPSSDFFFLFKEKESYFFLPEIKNAVFTPIWYFNVFKKLMKKVSDLNKFTTVSL